MVDAVFGPDKIVFGSDYPFGGMAEAKFKRTVQSVNEMNVSQSDKDKIFQKNAEKLLKIH